MNPAKEGEKVIVLRARRLGRSAQVEPLHDAFDAIMQRFHVSCPNASVDEYFAVKCTAARITGALVSLGEKPE